MKKSNGLVFLAVFAFFVMPIVSAAVSFDPLLPLYNVGDDFNVKLSVSKAAEYYDFLTVKLRCSASSVEIYKTPLQVSAGEKKNINFPVKLERFLIGELRGSCFIEGIYGADAGQSTSFEISSSAIVTAEVAELTINPGSLLRVSGKAIKKNGKTMEGNADISVPELGIKTNIPVKAGDFNVSLVILPETKARTYTVLVEAREYDSAGYPINDGSTSASFNVPQVPTTIDVALSSQKAMPGSEISYTVIVNDQAGEAANVESEISFIDPNGQNLIKNKVISSHLNNLTFDSNVTPGLWTIKAGYSSLEQSKFVSIGELENASFILQNRTLTIKNIGNIPYGKQVEVMIGPEKEIISELNIPVGSEEKYVLSAPEGSYPIVISEGNSTVPLGNVFLTGKAIGLRDTDDLAIEVSPWLWWILLILIGAVAAIYYYKRIMKRSYFGRTPKESSKESISITKAKPMALKEENGKLDCSVVSLHVKNFGQLEGVSDNPALDTIASMITRAKNAGAVVYNQGEHKVMVFSPKSVGSPALSAISLAKDMAGTLNEHNKKYALKVSFGIGINKGMMIAEEREGGVKFTSVGNTVVAAKKIAEYSKGEILMSEDLHRSVIGKVKAEKFGNKVWKLNSVAQRGQHSEFLKRFIDRNKF